MRGSLPSRAWFLLIVSLALRLSAAEAVLEIPDPIVIGVEVRATLAIIDPDKNVTGIELPDVAGLTLRRLGGYSSRTSIVNGVQSQRFEIPLAVRADAAGTYTVPAIALTLAGGGTLSSKPVTVTAGTGNGNLTGDGYGEVIFEPTAIVPGEPATMTYRVYTPVEAEFDHAIAPPSQAVVLETTPETVGTTIAATGATWRVHTWRWTLTFTEPGVQPVSGQQAAVFQVDDGWMPRRMRKTLPVKAGSLTVTALPDAGRPADFTGLIGPVTLNARANRTRIAVGEGATVELAIGGRQVHLLPRPPLPALSGVQIYPKQDDATRTTPTGTRTFAWDIVPTVAGTITVPAWSLPYFDPTTRTYQRIATQPVVITVIPGQRRDLSVAGGAMPANDPAPAAPRSLHEQLPPPRHGSTSPVPAPWLATVAALMALAAGLVVGLVARAPWRGRGPHRGRLLADALQRGDLAAAAAAMQTLLPSLRGSAREAAEHLSTAIDLARFGGRPLPTEATAWIAQLAGEA